MRNLATLNKGAEAGIQIGMSVISVNGLVGTIVGVSQYYSVVELINNRNVKIPAILSESKKEGIITWQEGENLLMNYISKTEDIKIGEIATTSLFSDLFPENIIIGEVINIEEEHGSHFYKITIQPATRFFFFSQLFVIDFLKDPEKVKLIQEVENRIIELRRRKN